MKKIIISLLIICIVITSTPISIGISDNSLFKDDSNESNPEIKIYKEGTCEGYTLLSVVETNGLIAYAQLIDMNGNEINRWNIDPSPAKMLSDGSVIGGEGFIDRIFHFEAVNITQMDWEGNVVWRFNNWDNAGTDVMMSRMHHDFQREGNPVGYYAPGQEFVKEGKTLVLAHYNTINTNISRKTLQDDVIYEVNWNGSLTGFEWHAADHFDEMGFSWRAKHGIRVSPGFRFLMIGDWLHINSVSYLGKNHWYDEDPINYSYFNPDNIIIDSRHSNFIAIISKETGKIVWKVGPYYPKKIFSGDKLNQIIGPHHAHMIPSGLPGEGNILVFDNGGWAAYSYFGLPNKLRFYSRVIEFNPVTNKIVWEYHDFFGRFWIPLFLKNHKFFSPLIGSAQRLPNGNTLICEGMPGKLIEVTPDNEIVWEYITQPVYRSIPLYRAYRVPPEWVPGNPSNYTFWEEDI